MKAQIVLENVGMHYPNRVLFDEVNWTLYEGMRVTLAGRNGCGKSTLMRILAGRLEPHEGQRSLVGGRNLKLGYLDQNLLDSAVIDTQTLKGSSPSVVDYIKHRILETKAEEEAEQDWQIERVLSGLGFDGAKQNGSIHELSGGWLLRMFIAGAILKKPDVLLLDEPTNHLDLSSIQWIENFLTKEYQGSLVLITHDVALQRRTTDALAIVHGARFYFRKHQKDYLAFRDSLGEEAVLLEKGLERLQKKHKDIMDFVQKYRAKARSASRAQSKLKNAEEIEGEMSALKERLSQIHGTAYNLRFRFRSDNLGPKFPLMLNNISFRYEANGPLILKGINLDTKRGQKIAIIGDNGAGKTTLLNVIGRNLKPQTGSVKTGKWVETGFFGQHQLDQLSLEDSLLDNLKQCVDNVSPDQLRGWLGAFGFSGTDEISKPAKVLSGGERARLALLRILVTPVNLILLDEPTNHLDIETKELLKAAMQEFQGTVIFVSHDREFINSIADRILYLSHDHDLTDHIGNLESFFEKYPQLGSQMDKVKKEVSKKETSSLSYEERKQLRNRAKSLEKQIATLEEDIDSQGEEKSRLQEEAEQASFYTPENENRRQEVFSRLSELESSITKKMIEWERLSSELELLAEESV
ncbi:MAG: ABC-F family ATP-binding cassette domain-containing protein [Bdellovibrionales bacterium]|nr:ABC-F family ATP-binding cassette domain-containing protein [Bdellovibrionales bacterium]